VAGQIDLHSHLRPRLGRKVGEEARPRIWLAAQQQSPADGRDAVHEAGQTRAARWIGAAVAVVTDADPHDPADRMDGDAHGRGVRVLGRVRQRLGHHVVCGDLDALGKAAL
jgi:hypothetical protein